VCGWEVVLLCGTSIPSIITLSPAETEKHSGVAKVRSCVMDATPSWVMGEQVETSAAKVQLTKSSNIIALLVQY
jgi:hypothetical protein